MPKQRKLQLPRRRQTSPNQAPDAEANRRLVAEGSRLLAAKRPGEAISRLSKAWELDASSATTAINLGGAYIMQGKHNSAVPYLEAATRLEPDNAMAWSNLAAAYLGKLPFATRKRQDRAINAYERSLALDPRAPHVHYNLGLIFMERDDLDRAQVHFRGALETDPTDSDALHWLDKLSSPEGI